MIDEVLCARAGECFEERELVVILELQMRVGKRLG
jgi:hypothetical protein